MKHLTLAPFIYEYPAVDAASVFAALHALPYSLWLDSSDRTHADSRYSYIAALPVETIELQGGRVTITNANQQTRMQGDLIEILRARMDAWRISPDTLPGLPPFQGGLAGVMGYEALSDISAEAMPDAIFGIYDQVIAFDHQQHKAWIITHADSKDSAVLKRQNLLRMIDSGQGFIARDNPALPWQAEESRAAYTKKIRDVMELIRAGDIFQANLSQRFTAALPQDFDCFAHYLTLRSVSPAPFGGYMNAGRIRISSASPEQFLRVRGTQVETRPIKGTRPRLPDEMADAAMRQDLKNSAKDQAENVMIVDLLRSDLSQVCTDDSVDVTALCALESFASVHHLVSCVEGILKNGCDALDVLGACFPGGSITGAPKIRAMEIIQQMEGQPRGPYCGSFIAIGFDGAMDSNILIRSIVYDGRTASLNAGGGITLQSDPDAEYDETMTKAAAILKSFEPLPTHLHITREAALHDSGHR